jgi:hypothetical protein
MNAPKTPPLSSRSAILDAAERAAADLVEAAIGLSIYDAGLAEYARTGRPVPPCYRRSREFVQGVAMALAVELDGHLRMLRALSLGMVAVDVERCTDRRMKDRCARGVAAPTVHGLVARAIGGTR